MTKFIFAFLVLCALCFARPIDDYGALKVQDGVIAGKNGNAAQLRGMSLFWNMWDEGRPYYENASNTVSTLANTWKANLVRAAIGDGNTTHAKNIIDAAINNGIYVIVDWHVHNANVNSATTFFTNISEYVKGKGNPPNVIYEIFNEPVNQPWSEIKSYAERIIPVIRKNNPDNLIIVGTPSYSSRVDQAAEAPITGTNAKNVAYAFHFYASEHGSNYRAYVNTAYCKKLPMFVTEWGTSPASGTGAINFTAVATWVNFMENRKLSHANWSISNKNESSSTNLNANSESGKYIKDLISKLNQGQSHKDVKNEPYTCSGEAPAQEGGGASISVDIQLEAENYNTLVGSAKKTQDANAIGGKMYLGPLNANESASYLLTAAQDTLIVLRIRYKSNAGATLEFNDGARSIRVTLPAQSSWTSSDAVPVVLHKTGSMSVKVISGSIDVDYFTWRSFYFGDAEANPSILGDLATWPEAKNWNLAPISVSSAKQTGLYAIRAANGKIIFENAPADAKISIFDAKGNLKANNALASGIYMVKINSQIQKVIVK